MYNWFIIVLFSVSLFQYGEEGEDEEEVIINTFQFTQLISVTQS